jgi:hypothetical protein
MVAIKSYYKGVEWVKKGDRYMHEQCVDFMKNSEDIEER